MISRTMIDNEFNTDSIVMIGDDKHHRLLGEFIFDLIFFWFPNEFQIASIEIELREGWIRL